MDEREQAATREQWCLAERAEGGGGIGGGDGDGRQIWWWKVVGTSKRARREQ